MDTNNKTNNPVYSHTDDAPVNLTEEQWKTVNQIKAERDLAKGKAGA